MELTRILYWMAKCYSHGITWMASYFSAVNHVTQIGALQKKIRKATVTSDFGCILQYVFLTLVPDWDIDFIIRTLSFRCYAYLMYVLINLCHHFHTRSKLQSEVQSFISVSRCFLKHRKLETSSSCYCKVLYGLHMVTYASTRSVKGIKNAVQTSVQLEAFWMTLLCASRLFQSLDFVRIVFVDLSYPPEPVDILLCLYQFCF